MLRRDVDPKEEEEKKRAAELRRMRIGFEVLRRLEHQVALKVLRRRQVETDPDGAAKIKRARKL